MYICGMCFKCTYEASSELFLIHMLFKSMCFVSLQVIKVYNEDNTSRTVEVPTDITARDICQLFVLKNHCIDDHSWTLFEHLTHLSIGKNSIQNNFIYPTRGN